MLLDADKTEKKESGQLKSETDQRKKLVTSYSTTRVSNTNARNFTVEKDTVEEAFAWRVVESNY